MSTCDGETFQPRKSALPTGFALPWDRILCWWGWCSLCQAPRVPFSPCCKMWGQNVPDASHSVLNAATCLPRAKRETKLGNRPNEGKWVNRYPGEQENQMRPIISKWGSRVPQASQGPLFHPLPLWLATTLGYTVSTTLNVGHTHPFAGRGARQIPMH